MSTLSARLQAMACASAKGSVTDSSGKIDPALLPLFQQSAGNVMNVQNQNPLGNYQGSNPMQVAGPNEVQRYGISNILGNGGPNQLDALALQDILRSPAMAQAGPTTGSYDPSQEMDLSQYFGALQSPHANVPQSYGQVNVPSMGPDVGPTKPYGAPSTPTGGGQPGNPGNPNGPGPGGSGPAGPGGQGLDPNWHHNGNPDAWELSPGSQPDSAPGASISPGSGADMSHIAPLAALAAGSGAPTSAALMSNWRYSGPQGGHYGWGDTPNWTGPVDSRGMPILGGYTYTGAQHEGSNPDMERDLASKGITPDQYRSFLRAGDERTAQMTHDFVRQTGSTNTDMWGNPMVNKRAPGAHYDAGKWGTAAEQAAARAGR